MDVTVIISYYKALENLKIILLALNNQSSNNFDVIISEDDSNEETSNFIEDNRKNYSFNITHLYQENDDGFKKNVMLNKCILQSRNDFLVFIDGDCVPHKHFIKEYSKNAEKGYFYSGRAVLLDDKITKYTKLNNTLKKLNFTSIILSNSTKKKDGIYFPYFQLSVKTKGIVGRNWGVHKQHLIDLNGFDADYVFAGVGEDVDIEWRLLANDIIRKSIKNRAIVYHLFHKKVYSEVKVKENYDIFYNKQKLNNIKCLNGIENIKQ